MAQPDALDNVKYQLLFRLLAGFAAIATVLNSSINEGADQLTLIAVPVILAYAILAQLFIRFSNAAKSTKNRTLSVVDALGIGALIAWINFDPLPSLLFALLLGFNAIICGGLKRFVSDALVAVIGAVCLIFIRQPAFVIETNWGTSLAVIFALGIYFCIYAYYTFTQSNSLKTRIKDLEHQQVQFKLRNYRLSKYLSPSLGKAIQSGKDVRPETQRKKLTIFFSDIKGFSELAEEMEADALTALLNNYLTEMSEIALKHGGTIDKFIGDAIMVFFGDPTSRGVKADCVAAVSMAVAMKKRMRELQLRWQNQGIHKPLEIRMGINSGFCTVGNFGTDNRLDYTLLGTEVNLASRLEAAAEPGEILVSHETYSLVKDVVMCRDKGEITVKGYQQPVHVYTVADMRKNLGKDQTYFEHMTDGFSIYLDMDKIKRYDKDRILISLHTAAEQLKNKDTF